MAWQGSETLHPYYIFSVVCTPIWHLLAGCKLETTNMDIEYWYFQQGTISGPLWIVK